MKQTLYLALALLICNFCFADLSALKGPKEWKKEQPKSRMRKAQFSIPAAEGDKANGSVVIFHFGKFGGGGWDANVARWKKQVVQGEGDPAPTVAKEQVNGCNVATYTQQGTYFKTNFGPRGGAKKPTKLAGHKVVNIMVESPNGPYFVKVVGPVKTIDANKKAIKEFVKSLVAATNPAKKAKPEPASKPAGD